MFPKKVPITLLWTHKIQFWLLWRTNIARRPKIWPKTQKHFERKKSFRRNTTLKCSSGRVEYSFNIPVTILSQNSIFFLSETKVDREFN